MNDLRRHEFYSCLLLSLASRGSVRRRNRLREPKVDQLVGPGDLAEACLRTCVLEAEVLHASISLDAPCPYAKACRAAPMSASVAWPCPPTASTRPKPSSTAPLSSVGPGNPIPPMAVSSGRVRISRASFLDRGQRGVSRFRAGRPRNESRLGS